MLEDEINPIQKLTEIEKMLKEMNCTYTIHKDYKEKDYTYMRLGDLCVTVENQTWEYPMYVDLENDGEFTLSYYKWHNHYYPEEWDFQRMLKDLQDVLQNKRCEIILNSTKKWLYSGLSEERLGEGYDGKQEIQKLPEEFQTELKQEGGKIELVYWNCKENVEILIEK